MARCLFLFLVILVQNSSLVAQVQPISEDKNEPMVLKNNGVVDKLEMQVGEIKSKPSMSKSHGKNDSENNLIFRSVKSPVRVSKDAVFVIKLSDADLDPESVIFLAKASIKKDSREIGYRGEESKAANGSNVSLDFETISPGVYKIIPKGLEAGQEYGFVTTTGGAKHGTAFLFGTK